MFFFPPWMPCYHNFCHIGHTLTWCFLYDQINLSISVSIHLPICSVRETAMEKWWGYGLWSVNTVTSHSPPRSAMRRRKMRQARPVREQTALSGTDRNGAHVTQRVGMGIGLEMWRAYGGIIQRSFSRMNSAHRSKTQQSSPVPIYRHVHPVVSQNNYIILY